MYSIYIKSCYLTCLYTMHSLHFVFGFGYPVPNTVIIYCINIWVNEFVKENAPVARTLASECFRFRNNTDLREDCQYNICKAVCSKSNRFPGNPPSQAKDQALLRHYKLY